MKVLQIYNQYRSVRSGEERAVFDIMTLMHKRGVEARLLMRTSRGIEHSLAKKVRAFGSGIYSFSAYREVLATLAEFQPDVVHVNNLYPLFSPSVLRACRRSRTPVVMTVHNYGLTCPTMYHLCGGKPCERCLGGEDYWCVVRNCRRNVAESIAYALRAHVATRLRFFRDLVTLFMVPTQFTKRLLTRAGFSEDRLSVLRNMVVSGGPPTDPSEGEYVAFAGRMSPEKGVDVLLEAARRLPDVDFRLAGEGPSLPDLTRAAPPNARFAGFLDDDALRLFLRQAAFLVVPSRWYEMCPLVISQAAGHGLPVVVSDLGGLSEMVRDGVDGFTFVPNDPSSLAERVRLLWDEPALRRRMGAAGYSRSVSDLGEDAYFDKLMNVYATARRLYR